MRIDLTNLNPSASFPFDYNDPEAGNIELRVASAGLLENLRKKHVKTVAEFRRGQRFEKQITNHDGYELDFWDYCIVGWTGLTDVNGEDIPCTAENKALLMSGSPQFAEIVRERMERLQEENAKRAEDAEKN